MQARMKHPVMILPDALQALQAASAALDKAGLPEKTAKLVHLRASQINGCSWCVDMHARELKQLGEPDERLWAVAAWRENVCFNDAERAALALTDAATRIADRGDPVPDEVWDAAARHYDERTLAALVMHIGFINFWNRLNVMTRMIAGQKPRWER